MPASLETVTRSTRVAPGWSPTAAMLCSRTSLAISMVVQFRPALVLG